MFNSLSIFSPFKGELTTKVAQDLCQSIEEYNTRGVVLTQKNAELIINNASYSCEEYGFVMPTPELIKKITIQFSQSDFVTSDTIAEVVSSVFDIYADIQYTTCKFFNEDYLVGLLFSYFESEMIDEDGNPISNTKAYSPADNLTDIQDEAHYEKGCSGSLEALRDIANQLIIPRANKTRDSIYYKSIAPIKKRANSLDGLTFIDDQSKKIIEELTQNENIDDLRVSIIGSEAIRIVYETGGNISLQNAVLKLIDFVHNQTDSDIDAIDDYATEIISDYIKN